MDKPDAVGGEGPPMFDLSGKRIYVAGHRGMVGAALCRRLGSEPCEVLTADRAALDLEDRATTEAWVRRARPDAVVVETGVPQAPPCGALHIATHGAARVCAQAAAEVIAGR